MKRKTALLAFLVLILAVAVGWWNRSGSQPTPSTREAVSSPVAATTADTPAADTHKPSRGPMSPTAANASLSPQDRANLEKIGKAFSTPISFWGRVVDQHGYPVPSATVHYSAADKYFKDGSKYEGISDARGFFSIANIKGAGLYVRVAKEGYYHIEGQSARSFGYGIPSATAPPGKESPATLVLHKMGETEPLLQTEGAVPLPRDGTPTRITLRRQPPIALVAGAGDIHVEVWTDDQNKDAQRRYDWRCRFTVPGGGLIARNNPLDFTAPAGGYATAFEHVMPRTGSDWTNSLRQEFFLQLSDGTYARVKFNLVAGGDHFVHLQCVINPKPGRRNLEFDPKLAITPEPHVP